MFNTLETHEKLKYPRCTMGDDYSRELSRLATVQKTGHMHLKTRATHTTTKWLATDLELPSQPPPPKETTTTTTTTTTQDGKIVLRLTWSMFGVSGVHGCRVSRERNKASQQTMPAHQPLRETTTGQHSKELHLHTYTQAHSECHTQSALGKLYFQSRCLSNTCNVTFVISLEQPQHRHCLPDRHLATRQHNTTQHNTTHQRTTARP